MNYDVNNEDNNYFFEPVIKTKIGYHLGFILEAPILNKNLLIQTGLLYNNKGHSINIKETFEDIYDEIFGKENYEIYDVKGYYRINYNYLEIPVNIAYTYNDFQFSMGPYVAFGVGGKFNYDYKYKLKYWDEWDDEWKTAKISEDEKGKIIPIYGKLDKDTYEKYTKEEDEVGFYRGLDLGMNLGLGYKFGNFTFNLNYSLGFSNTTPKYDVDDELDEDITENVVVKNRVLMFSVSYFLK